MFIRILSRQAKLIILLLIERETRLWSCLLRNDAISWSRTKTALKGRCCSPGRLAVLGGSGGNLHDPRCLGEGLAMPSTVLLSLLPLCSVHRVLVDSWRDMSQHQHTSVFLPPSFEITPEYKAIMRLQVTEWRLKLSRSVLIEIWGFSPRRSGISGVILPSTSLSGPCSIVSQL